MSQKVLVVDDEQSIVTLLKYNLETAGYIVDVGDSEQASDYALKLLTDEQLYQELQSNMLKDIKQRFSSELIVDQYEYYYKKMLN